MTQPTLGLRSHVIHEKIKQQKALSKTLNRRKIKLQRSRMENPMAFVGMKREPSCDFFLSISDDFFG